MAVLVQDIRKTSVVPRPGQVVKRCPGQQLSCKAVIDEYNIERLYASSQGAKTSLLCISNFIDGLEVPEEIEYISWDALAIPRTTLYHLSTAVTRLQ